MNQDMQRGNSMYNKPTAAQAIP